MKKTIKYIKYRIFEISLALVVIFSIIGVLFRLDYLVYIGIFIIVISIFLVLVCFLIEDYKKFKKKEASR